MIHRTELLKSLQRELPKTEKDILSYSESREDLTEHLNQEYQKAKNAGRTAEHFVAWREAQITQAAVAWLLTCVFVRFLEDNQLIKEPMLSGPVQTGEGSKSLQHAKERMVAYFNENPKHAEREYLLNMFEQLEQFPVIAELLDHRHNPLWQIPVSGDGAKQLIDFFQNINPETGDIVHDFTDPNWDTRFLGDLYQDLSESVRKRYALLQTPEFVESFILDYTLEKAKETFGLKGLRLIDPTCGSGHFLLTTFERVFNDWIKREPATNTRELAQRALDVVHGVDINPYAIAICRFRLLIVAMKVSGTKKIKDAPDFHFNLACGDSLLHGRRFEWQGQGIQAELIDDDPIKHVLEVEDKDKLLKILGQQYHIVVGNPPYIVVKDKALNDAYRDKYTTCSGRYSLGVPFTERFFDLVLSSEEVSKSGYLGIITANSFMKRVFGKKLIESFLSNKYITHVVDSSGAYIPGHGTPTVIMFARNSKPSADVFMIKGIKAEPSTPDNPKDGLVWTSIKNMTKNLGGENEFISAGFHSKETLFKHPWSLTGGGADEVLSLIESKKFGVVKDVIQEFGVASITGDDSHFVFDSDDQINRHGNWPIRKYVFGECVRDWTYGECSRVVWTYDKSYKALKMSYKNKIGQYFWKNRVTLTSRTKFGAPILDKGLCWYEWREVYPKKLKAKYLITFGEIASHNHFVLVKTLDISFAQSAPVIRLKEESIENYYRCTAYFNSSLFCFLMKQVSHQKQLTGGDGVRVASLSKVPYQFASTALKKLPIPERIGNPSIDKIFINLGKEAIKIAKSIDCLKDMDRLIVNCLNDEKDIEESWKSSKLEIQKLTSQMILIQEEIDWSTYCSFGLCEEGLMSDMKPWMEVDLDAGQRPFEILFQENQDGFNVPSDIPSYWPEDMRDKWRQRIEVIQNVRAIKVIEGDHYKRRWIGRQGLFNLTARADELKIACKKYMLDRLENSFLKENKSLITCAMLADFLRLDTHFIKIATLYTGKEFYDIQKLVSALVNDESIPQIAALRLKPLAIKKYYAWNETFEKQRMEDAIDAEFGVYQPLSEQDAKDPEIAAQYEKAKQQAINKKMQTVGDIPVPPKYASSDFRKASYWPLRGKLDVPKERFFSLPGCEKDGDSTLVIGWAGMNHLQRAQAIAAWYIERKETEGWEAEKLKPMLVALDELIPWLKQWHNDIDPEYGERMGDFYEGFLLEELRLLDIARDDLLSWEPPAAPKKKRATKKKKSAVAE